MRLRPLLLTALVVALAASNSASAATKYCNVLTDKRGDEPNGIAWLDVLSADIATGKTELVAVLRMGGTFPAGDLLTNLDWAAWTFGATLNGTDYDFSRTQPSFHGAPSTGLKVGTTNPKYTFAVEGNNYVWRIKRSDLPSLTKKANQRFTTFHAASWYRGSSDDHAGGDVASAKKYYPDKAPSCVKAR